MAYVNLSISAKAARLQALNAAIGANATVVIYDNAVPLSPELAPSANALVSFGCNVASFGTVVVANTVGTLPAANGGNVAVTVSTVGLRALPIAPELAAGNGIAGWARISTQNGTAVLDLDIGMAANASVVMNSTALLGGLPVQIVSITLTEL